MQFSDTTNKNGSIQRCESLCLLGDTGISANATLLKQFTAYINSAYYEIWMAGLSVDKHNPLDDYNSRSDASDNIPNASITLVAGQADYTLPVAVSGDNVATFLRCRGVYFQEATGERTYLTQMSDNSFTTTSGEPVKYKINGKSFIFQCPVSSATATKYTSVHVEFQRVPDAFLSTDTTQQAGFMETYHDLIPLKASATYLLPTNANLATQYEQRFLTRLELFKRDIAMFDDNTPRRLTPSVESCE